MFTALSCLVPSALKNSPVASTIPGSWTLLEGKVWSNRNSCCIQISMLKNICHGQICSSSAIGTKNIGTDSLSWKIETWGKQDVRMIAYKTGKYSATLNVGINCLEIAYVLLTHTNNVKKLWDNELKCWIVEPNMLIGLGRKRHHKFTTASGWGFGAPHPRVHANAQRSACDLENLIVWNNDFS